MKFIPFKEVALFIFTAALFFSNINEGNTKPIIYITIHEDETMSATLIFDLPTTSSQEQKDQRFTALLIPFEIPKATPIRAQNGALAFLIESGQEFTIIMVISPTTTNEITLYIDNFGILTDAGNERSKLEYDHSYEYLPSLEKNLLNNSLIISNWNYRIDFPQTFNKTDVFLSPNTIIWLDEKTIYSPKNTNPNEKITIAIPSANSNNNSKGSAILGFLGSFLYILWEGYEFRNKKILVLILAFIISTGIIVIGVFFTLNSESPLYFLTAAATALPISLYSLFVCLFLFLAKKFEITITGKVTLDDEPLDFASVTLQINKKHNMIKSLHKKDLKDGFFVFYVWSRKSEVTCKIMVETAGTKLYQSRFISIKPGNKHVAPTIKLEHL